MLVSVLGARLLSAGVNFALNRRVVFGDTGDARSSLRRYASLAVAILAANYTLLAVLTGLGTPLVAAKLVVETVLFATSYVVQRRLVFSRPRAASPAPMSSPLEMQPKARLEAGSAR